MPNPYVNKVVRSNGTTLIDISDTTAVAADVASGKYFYLATGEKVPGTASGGGDEPSRPTYETIVPEQTINCTIDLSNGAYGGYITPYTEYTQSGEKYRVYYDGTEYGPLTATYYGDGTTYLYVGDVNVMLSSSATLTYPFVIMLYNGSAFYLAVRGSGSHTLQVDKMTSEGSGGGGDTSSNPLAGKIATFTGDSICAGGEEGGYAGIIRTDYGMTVENLGVYDGTVVEWQDKFCISESIADMRSDADFVILEGGGNDADWGPQYIPVGTLTSGYNATLDTTTFAGAFEQMLKSAIAKFSNAKIGYIFVHKCVANFDAPSGAYHTMAISALEKWGIPYLDLNVMIPPLGYIDDLKNTYTRGDGIHPNELGYRTFYAPKIAAFMQSMITEKNLIAKTVTANGTYLASDDDADGYDSVTVNVPSGASNIVTGTFKGTTTGAAMDVNLDYSGSGYPVAIIIYPKEGAYNSNSAVYALVQRNATLWFNAVKAYADVAPDYDNDGTEDQYTITNRTKNSSSSSTGYGTNISPSQIVASGGNAAQTVQNVVKLKSNTKMSVYIASSSYGFPANIEFTYHVIYSS